MKKTGYLLSLPIILCLGACAQQAQVSNSAFQPPVEGVEWGMMPEEVTEILSLPEESILNHDGKVAIIQCEDMDVFGQSANVEMTFDLQSCIGLLNVSVCFIDIPEESLLDIVSNIYGEDSVIDREGCRGLWESIRIEELPERVQERFRYMWADCLSWNDGQGGFSKDTVWDGKKGQPLVTVTLNDNLLNCNGENMAAYLIYDDDDAYEEFQSYLKGISDAIPDNS